MAEFLKWAQANTLAAIALLGAGTGAVIGVVIAVGKNAQPIGQLVRTLRGKNGNGKHEPKPADGVGEHTADLAKDLDALAHDACATEEDLAVVRADVQRVDKLVTGSPGGMQERLAIVENICLETRDAVAALPEKLAQQLAGLVAQRGEKDREQLVRETSVASAKVVYRILRREGVLEERRKNARPVSPHLDRRAKGQDG